MKKNLLLIVALLVSACGGGEPDLVPTTTTPPPVVITQSELPAAVLTAFGADPTKTDTDGDGLTDEFEIKYGYPYLKPDSKDTNNNGVNDADEDSDVDGLTNIQEQQYKTHPLMADSDGDGLSDKDEIFTYTTDPNNPDTDGDGIKDGREVANGSNPLAKDADKVVTSSQTQKLISSNGQISNVSVQMTGAGDLSSQVVVKNLSDQKISGQIGQSYDIGLKSGDSSSVNATVTLPYDKTDPDAADPSKLAIFTVNPTTGAYEELPSTVDQSTGTIRATTNHFTPFFVANTTSFKAFLGTVPQTCDLITDPNAKPADVVLVVDSSGSMGWNDPSNIRKSAAKSFASKMKSTDRVAVVDFDDRAHLAIGLSNNLTSINAAIDTIDSSGGTDIGAGVSIALTQLTASGDSTKNRAVIILTDGDGSYDTSLTTQLANSGIRVFTIGLTGSVNTTLLQGIATGTNGGYKQIQTADGLNDIFTEFASVFGDSGKDTDGDGLTDCQETQGIYLMNLGRAVKTDPTKPDTDGDGLDDGVEVGAIYRAPLVVTSTVWAAKGFSNPEAGAVDSDGDGLTDYEEAKEGTNSFSKDTDGDGIWDKEEIEGGTDPEDPSDPNEQSVVEKSAWKSSITYAYKFGNVIWGVGEGAVLGDFTTIDSWPKFVGITARNFMPSCGVLDGLDGIANTINGDWVSTSLAFGASASGVGQCAAVVGAIGTAGAGTPVVGIATGVDIATATAREIKIAATFLKAIKATQKSYRKVYAILEKTGLSSTNIANILGPVFKELDPTQYAAYVKSGLTPEDIVKAFSGIRKGEVIYQIGKAGEDAVSAVYDIGKKTTFIINGRTRIADGWNTALKTISEVKNVKTQGLTRQIKDYIDAASINGYKFELYVRESTKLSEPLAKAIADGLISLKFIP